MENARARRFVPLATALLLLFVACSAHAVAQEKPRSAEIPSIAITKVPPGGEGENSWGTISGSTIGANPADQRVVIYARTDQWYVQPWVAKPFTALRKDGSFQTGTHLGDEYAALLVDHSFVPRATFPLADLPSAGSGILAIVRAEAGTR